MCFSHSGSRLSETILGNKRPDIRSPRVKMSPVLLVFQGARRLTPGTSLNHWSKLDLLDLTNWSYKNILVGGVPTPLKKNKYQLGFLFPIYWVTLFLAQIDDDFLGKIKGDFMGWIPLYINGDLMVIHPLVMTNIAIEHGP